MSNRQSSINRSRDRSRSRSRSRTRSRSRDRLSNRQSSINRSRDRSRSRSRSRTRSRSRDRYGRERQREKRVKEGRNRSRSKEVDTKPVVQVQADDQPPKLIPLINNSGGSRFNIYKTKGNLEFECTGLVSNKSPLQQVLHKNIIIKGKSSPDDVNKFICTKEKKDVHCFRLYAQKSNPNFEAFKLKGSAWYTSSEESGETDPDRIIKGFLVPKSLKSHCPVLQSLGDLKDDSTNELLLFGVFACHNKPPLPLSQLEPKEVIVPAVTVRAQDPRLSRLDPRRNPLDPRVKPNPIKVSPTKEIETIETVNNMSLFFLQSVIRSPDLNKRTETIESVLEKFQEKNDIQLENIEVCKNYLQYGSCKRENCGRRHYSTEEKIQLFNQEVYERLRSSTSWVSVSDFGLLLKTYYISEKVSVVLGNDPRFKFKRGKSNVFVKVAELEVGTGIVKPEIRTGIVKPEVKISLAKEKEGDVKPESDETNHNDKYDFPCKYVQSPGGCRRGDACRYLHGILRSNKSREKGI